MRRDWTTNGIQADTTFRMTVPPNPDAEAAMQYLIWALEEIEKKGNAEAAAHARRAREALREGHASVEDPSRGHARHCCPTRSEIPVVDHPCDIIAIAPAVRGAVQ
jgi:hypothetical protein